MIKKDLRYWLIMKRLEDHYNEALQYFPEDRIVGLFLQGSQNYGLETDTSDVDTKCILTPSFEEIALGKKMVSTTHILDNNEHLDAKERAEIFEKVRGNSYDVVLTHTCPSSWRPVDLFLPQIDQSTVDNTMEDWLEDVKNSITWGRWCFGHYHADRIERENVKQFYFCYELFE